MVMTSQSDAHHVGKVLNKNTSLAEILVGFSKWKEFLEVLSDLKRHKVAMSV